MSNTRIQIKRATTTAAPTAGSLYAGELAFSNSSQVLYIGNPDAANTVTPIGTKLNWGTLTANAVLVTNASSGIDKVRVANLVALQGIWANGASGSAGDILVSGGSGANAYWIPQGAVSINVNATYTWTNTHTFSNIVYHNANLVVNTSSTLLLGAISASTNGVLVQNNLITVGNTLVNTQIVPASVSTSTLNIATNKFIANSTQVTIAAGVGLSANGGIGTSAQVLTSNGSSVYWDTNSNGTVTSVASGNGILGGTITGSGTLYAKAANGISVDSSGINVVGSNGIISNSSGVYVNANNNFTVNATGLWVNTSAALTVQDLTLNGNLVVSGTLTTIDTTNLSVKDNMIILADQLATTTSFLDNVDTGWYVKTGNTLNSFNSGLVRIAGSSTNTNPYFKLFSTTTAPNNTTIDTNATTGTLQSFLAPWGAGGALVVNGTNIAVTANGSVNVSITANSLTLSTALATTSGGTGLNSYTTGDILYASGTNTLNKLGIGSDGNVLQIQSSTIAWGSIDAGTF